ncbi:MAG TPA: diguanylate cyclase [Kineosporiaceae bacterium]|nr:diguanylate cyclase [Kineosporiaceae bacterium]
MVHGKSSPDDPVPLAPLRSALEGYLDAVGRFPQDERDRVHDLVRAAAGPAAGLLGGLTPGLGALLGVSQRVDGQDQFTLAVVGFLTDLACACGGLLLVLDDVQWLDPGTARVLASLSGALDGVPLMVVVTARNDRDSAAATDTLVASLGGAVDLDLELAPLDESGVAELVRTLMPGVDTANSLARLMAVRSSGNPFVVLEYLRAIVDAGLLRPCWGTWLLDEDALDTLELPQDALGLVLTRVRGLGSRVRELLVTAAAVGARFRPQLVAAVQGVELDVVLAAAVEAAGHGLVEPREGGEFAFLHDRIREALHDELDAAGSARLHQRIAAALQAMPVPEGGHAAGHVYAVAHHYMAGEAGSSELAFAACWAAGQLALDNYAPTDAVAFLQYAAGIGGATDGRFLLVFGSALKQNGQYAEARRRLEQAAAVETAPASRARILTMLADTYRASWHIEQAVAAVEQGLAELGAPLPRNPLRLALSTAVMFAAAQLMRWTGWRFGSARGDERLRCTLIAGLHEVGVYVGALNTRPEQVIMHSLRTLYWVNRIGEGAQYARSQGSLGFFYAMLGLRRTSERAFARVAADPAGSEPGVRALTASSRGAALCLGYHDNGEAWIRGLEQYGQWLDLATYCDSLTTLTLDAVSQGRLPEATRWLALGQRRLTLRVGELSSMSLSLITPTVHAIMGRPGEAAGMLRRAEEQLGDECPLGMAVLRQLVRLVVLREQDEVGEPFDRAVSDFEGLGLSAALLVRSNRVVHFHIAMGRLAQCRAATGDDRTVRLTVARDAVRALRKARKGQELRARERIARADLHVLEGEPGKALTVLERGDPIQHPDAPLLAYESARVRARALAALGSAEQSRRQALLALAIAEDSGWPHRAGWVTAEFGSVGGRSTGTSIQMTGYHRGDPGASATVRSSRIAGSVASVGGSSSAAVGMERQRLAALQQVTAAASRVLDPGALARIALDETIRILAADRAFLFLTGADDLLVPHLGRDAAGHDVTDLTGYSASLVARVHRTREPLVVTGTQEGAALGAQSVVLHGLRSIMVAPLQLEGRLLGVVYLDSQVAKGIFTADDVGILLALTNHIATSLETARAAQLEISVRTVQRQRDLADTLREALESMADTIEPQQVLARLLSWAVRVVGCDDGWLLADDGHGATLTGLAPNGELSTRAVDRDPGLAVLLGSELPVLGSAATAPPPLHAQLSGATSWIALPLRSGQAVLGVLILAARTPEVRLQEHVEVASALVAQGMTAHDRASLFTQVQLLAVADELTGIANRRHFFEVAERDVAAAAAADRPLTALMVDIDHFKAVNDTYGHPTGDDVIRTVAQRLAAVIRQTDLVGRYGGEEFAVILPDADLGSDLPERLRACIADVPVQTRSGPLPVSVSIGLAHLRPDDADVATVLARADQALYRAKQEGRNRVHTA